LSPAAFEGIQQGKSLRAEETWLSHRQGKSDKNTYIHGFPGLPVAWACGVNDVRIRGKGISDFHIYLCHNDKSFDGCCISGSKSGMTLPWGLVSFRRYSVLW
jgi:hypothetical protein